MPDWRLVGYDQSNITDLAPRTAWVVEDRTPNPLSKFGYPGYSVKLLRDIHRALQALPNEDYARLRELLKSEEELYE
jgi:hypothetical protein